MIIVYLLIIMNTIYEILCLWDEDEKLLLDFCKGVGKDFGELQGKVVGLGGAGGLGWAG